jgi:cytochrome c oxidase cbb3-type subunit IV
VVSENAYIVYTIVLLALFIGVLFWAFGKKRKKRFEQDAEIPFQDKP